MAYKNILYGKKTISGKPISFNLQEKIAIKNNSNTIMDIPAIFIKRYKNNSIFLFGLFLHAQRTNAREIVKITIR